MFFSLEKMKNCCLLRVKHRFNLMPVVVILIRVGNSDNFMLVQQCLSRKETLFAFDWDDVRMFYLKINENEQIQSRFLNEIKKETNKIHHLFGMKCLKIKPIEIRCNEIDYFHWFTILSSLFIATTHHRLIIFSCEPFILLLCIKVYIFYWALS